MSGRAAPWSARGTGAVALALAVASLSTACAGARRSGTPVPGDVDGAELARCAYADSDGWGTDEVAGLAGEWRLVVANRGSARAAGILALRPPDAGPGAPAIAGPATPRLIGWAEVPFADVGAIVPGAADARDPAAPGVALYVFEEVTEDAEAEGAAPVVVLRIGSEANRRDRQRFDGAHTTLRVSSILADRFGGTWSSAEAADERGGSFCAVRP